MKYIHISILHKVIKKGPKILSSFLFALNIYSLCLICVEIFIKLVLVDQLSLIYRLKTLNG